MAGVVTNIIMENSVQTPVAQACPHRILVADDNLAIAAALKLLLKGEGFPVEIATTPQDAIAALERQQFDVALFDLNYTRDTTSGAEGLDLLTRVRTKHPELQVIVLTAWGNIELAVEAMQRGACDFLLKPWDNRRLVATLRERIDMHHRALRDQSDEQREQVEATELQRKLFPSKIPQVAGYDLHLVSRSARFVGGDYFDVQQSPRGEVAFSIADVCGKGVPAAMVMAALSVALKPLIADNAAPEQVCAELNSRLRGILHPCKFVTFYHAVLDPATGTLRYSNAGHQPAMLLRRDGTVETLAAGGAVLGYFEQWQYQTGSVTLNSGDTLLMFTDGLVDALNAAGEEFSVERLVKSAITMRHLDARTMTTELVDGVARHCAGNFGDDVTLCAVRRA
jgi:sigma-B regulation protein RsbU (phosphoserine phosphatase)